MPAGGLVAQGGAVSSLNSLPGPSAWRQPPRHGGSLHGLVSALCIQPHSQNVASSADTAPGWPCLGSWGHAEDFDSTLDGRLSGCLLPGHLTSVGQFFIRLLLTFSSFSHLLLLFAAVRSSADTSLPTHPLLPLSCSIILLEIGVNLHTCDKQRG